MPQPMRVLSADTELKIDGYLCPAHVSTITGPRIYRFLAEDTCAQLAPHVELAGATVLEIYHDAALEAASDHPFKGNLDPQKFRDAIARYGAERGSRVRHAEAFEICEYGRRPPDGEIRELFPMLK